MRTTLSLGALAALCLPSASAFPAALFEMAERDGVDPGALHSRLTSSDSEGRDAMRKRLLGISPGFDASKQYISTSGANQFVAPSSTDLRGPCPGLNALANHNYIPHNGIATIQQFIDGTTQVFGMGNDLAGFLSIYGAVIDGDLTSWSIGGAPPASGLVSGLLGTSGLGLLGAPGGITNSHNKYEGDASPTRPDLYQYGNDYKVIVPQFEAMFALQPDAATANYDLPVLTEFRNTRFAESVANNPYFFNGPFSGVLVQPAAYTFIYRFMANHSQEYPEGRLDQDVLKAFFSITGSPGSFVWTEGHERIPDNWYRRAFGDEYTIPFFMLDVLAAAETYPKFLDIGGNTGTTNSFTGVDIQHLTGGVFNAQTLLQGNNLQCFLFQISQQATPDLLKGSLLDTVAAQAQINQAFSTVLAPLACPQLQSVDMAQFDNYPGYKRSQ